jgi:hypothetical protein
MTLRNKTVSANRRQHELLLRRRVVGRGCGVGRQRAQTHRVLPSHHLALRALPLPVDLLALLHQIVVGAQRQVSERHIICNLNTYLIIDM